MDDSLLLPVSYLGKDYEFPLRIGSGGYAPRYFVWVQEIEVIIERDDQGEFRALIYDAEANKAKLPERGLLECISATIAQLAE